MKKDSFQEGDVVKHKKNGKKARGVVERYDSHDDTARVNWDEYGDEWEYAREIILIERQPITITDSYV